MVETVKLRTRNYKQLSFFKWYLNFFLKLSTVGFFIQRSVCNMNSRDVWVKYTKCNTWLYIKIFSGGGEGTGAKESTNKVSSQMILSHHFVEEIKI